MDGDGDLFKEAHEKISVRLSDLLVKIPSELRADCEKLHLEVLWQAECMFKQFLIQMTADSKNCFEELKRKMLTHLKSDEEIRKVRDEIVALLQSEFIQDCNFNSKATRDSYLDAMLDGKFNEVHEKFNEVHEKIRVILRDLLVKVPSEVRADCKKLHLEVLRQAEAMFNQFLIQVAADFKKFFEEEKREMLMQLKSDEKIRKMREEIVAQLRSDEIKQDQDR